jgi:hypothetical protein
MQHSIIEDSVDVPRSRIRVINRPHEDLFLLVESLEVGQSFVVNPVKFAHLKADRIGLSRRHSVVRQVISRVEVSMRAKDIALTLFT